MSGGLSVTQTDHSGFVVEQASPPTKRRLYALQAPHTRLGHSITIANHCVGGLLPPASVLAERWRACTGSEPRPGVSTRDRDTGSS